MTSKLFRAIVGLGITLGTASVACLGTVNNGPDEGEPTGSNPNEPAEGSVLNPDAFESSMADGGRDAHSDRSVGDAPHDVVLDAFCDAAWPTTKGSSGGSTCGPIHECMEAGPSPRCYPAVDPITCNSSAATVPAWCIGGAWQCSTGALPQEACKCWTGTSSPTCPDR